MPYKDPEKAREAKRRSAQRRREREGSTPRRPRVDPEPASPVQRSSPTLRPFRPIFIPLPGYEENAERMLSIFSGDYTAVLYADMTERRPGQVQGARVLRSQWRGYTLAALSHHLDGETIIHGCPKWCRNALWGAATVATEDDKDALLEALAGFGCQAYWAEYPWAGIVVYIFFRRPLAAGVIARFLARAALTAGVHATVAPRRRKYQANGQVPVLLPYAGRAFPLHDSAGRTIPLETLPKAIIRNPRPPRLDRNGDPVPPKGTLRTFRT